MSSSSSVTDVLVVVQQRRHPSLVVSGVRRLRAMVAVFDQAWWWWGRYLRLRTSVVVRSWLGWVLLVTNGLSGVVGGWSVVVWVFAVRSNWWWATLVPCRWWWPLSIEHGGGGGVVVSVFGCPSSLWAFLGCRRSFCGRLGVFSSWLLAVEDACTLWVVVAVVDRARWWWVVVSVFGGLSSPVALDG